MMFVRAIGVCVVMILAAMWPAAARADVTVWNYDINGNAYRMSDPKPVTTITISGTRNGHFSGAVAVGSSKAISGLHAKVSDLSMAGASIPADQVTVRYAVSWDAMEGRPPGLDVLLESPPATVGLSNNRAVAGIWLTVAVPENAKAGVYKGQLTVETQDLAAKTIPIELSVADWRAPDPQDQRTWIEVIQSPDTLALEYGVPLWSDKHWAMIEKSFQLIRPTGSRVVYIPLLRYTNQGNAESMVRWIRQKDGTYKQDYSIMEKYLDVAQKNLGELKFVVFYAWDSFLTTKFRNQNFEIKPTKPGPEMDRWEKLQQGLTVTMLDEATGTTEPGFLPHYTAPESPALWQPVYAELRKRMKARGLEKAMCLGMVTDMEPSKADVKVLQEVTGGLPWIAHSHYARMRSVKNAPVHNKLLAGIADICYEAHAYDLTYQVNPEKGHLYGWKIPELSAFLDRFGELNGSPLRVRQVTELNIMGGQRGVGRLGGDFWPAIKDKRGQRAGQAFARYPENHWRGLNIGSWLLAPGPDGPVATSRLEALREGVQECEARIAIESALLNEQSKSRLGTELAERAQKVLDDHQRALWRSIWSDEEVLTVLGRITGRDTFEALWDGWAHVGKKLPDFWSQQARKMRSDENAKGIEWFVNSDWKKRDKDLFDVAGEVQKKLK